jgi:hypothetical protein
MVNITCKKIQTYVISADEIYNLILDKYDAVDGKFGQLFLYKETVSTVIDKQDLFEFSIVLNDNEKAFKLPPYNTGGECISVNKAWEVPATPLSLNEPWTVTPIKHVHPESKPFIGDSWTTEKPSDLPIIDDIYSVVDNDLPIVDDDFEEAGGSQ